VKFLPDPAGNELTPWSRRFDCLLPLALLALVQRVIKMIPTSQSTKAEERQRAALPTAWAAAVTCGGGRMGTGTRGWVETQ